MSKRFSSYQAINSELALRKRHAEIDTAVREALRRWDARAQVLEAARWVVARAIPGYILDHNLRGHVAKVWREQHG